MPRTGIRGSIPSRCNAKLAKRKDSLALFTLLADNPLFMNSHAEVQITLNSGNVCYRSVRNVLVPSRLLKNTNEQNIWNCNLKSKVIPLTGSGGPYICETSILSHFLHHRLTDGGETVSLTSRPSFTQNSWYSFLLEAESTPGPQRGWKVRSIQKSSVGVMLSLVSQRGRKDRGSVVA
jgi:hypothetical protein